MENLTSIGSDASDVFLLPDVVFVTAPDGSARLLNLDGAFYAIDATGTEFLRTALSHDLSQAVGILANSWKTSELLIKDDLLAFLNTLQIRSLIGLKSQRRRHTAFLRRTVPRISMSTLLFLLRHCFWSDRWRIRFLLIFARLSFLAFGFRKTVGCWAGNPAGPIPNTAQFDQTFDLELTSDLIREAGAGSWLSVECKERALSAWKLLKWKGMRPVVTVGLSLYPLQGHCWCMCDGRVIGDDVDRCDMFVPVAWYE